jgi:dethiobiotin synthetase
MSRRLFVTGTDTGVGKTFVATRLCELGRRRGWRVVGHKPIETGCEIEHGERRAADAMLLVESSGAEMEADCQCKLLAPMAPHPASRLEGVAIDLATIVSTIQRLVAAADLAIVEGAGGWRVPITEHEDMAALANRLGWPVVIVARGGLGTINHSLLTIEAVERDGLSIAAVVLSNRPDDDPTFVASNRNEIARRWRGRVEMIETIDQLLD